MINIDIIITIITFIILSLIIVLICIRAYHYHYYYHYELYQTCHDLPRPSQTCLHLHKPAFLTCLKVHGMPWIAIPFERNRMNSDLVGVAF